MHSCLWKCTGTAPKMEIVLSLCPILPMYWGVMAVLQIALGWYIPCFLGYKPQNEVCIWGGPCVQAKEHHNLDELEGLKFSVHPGKVTRKE